MPLPNEIPQNIPQQFLDHFKQQAPLKLELREVTADNLAAMAALSQIMRTVNDRWKELDKGSIQYDYMKDVLLPTLKEHGVCFCTKHRF